MKILMVLAACAATAANAKGEAPTKGVLTPTAFAAHADACKLQQRSKSCFVVENYSTTATGIVRLLTSVEAAALAEQAEAGSKVAAAALASAAIRSEVVDVDDLR